MTPRERHPEQHPERHPERHLERHSRWLLLAYPRRYRRQRGEEMLGTLLDATPPGRTWPTPRDTAALIMGGFRVRAGQNQPQPTAASVRQGIVLGAALALIQINVGYLTGLIAFWMHDFPEPFPPRASYQAAFAVAALAAVAAAWFAPRIITAGAALVAAALWVWGSDGIGDGHGWVIPAVVALVTLAILTPARPRLPRSWLWLAGLWLVVNTLPGLAPTRQQLLFPLDAPLHTFSWIILAAVALWIVVDARLGLALAAYAASYYALPQLLGYADYMPRPLSPSWFYFAGGATLILTLAAARQLRQMRRCTI
jgi:hypothetical protein